MRWIVGPLVGLSVSVTSPCSAEPFSALGNPPGRVGIFDEGSRIRTNANVTGIYFDIRRDEMSDGTQYQEIFAEFNCEKSKFRILKLTDRRLDGTEVRSTKTKSGWSELGKDNRIITRACASEAGEILLDGKGQPLQMWALLVAAIGGMRDGKFK